MTRNWKRGFAGASAIGSVIAVGVFGWLFFTGVFPLELFVLFAGVNVVVGLFSLRLAMGA